MCFFHQRGPRRAHLNQLIAFLNALPALRPGRHLGPGISDSAVDSEPLPAVPGLPCPAAPPLEPSLLGRTGAMARGQPRHVSRAAVPLRPGHRSTQALTGSPHNFGRLDGPPRHSAAQAIRRAQPAKPFSRAAPPSPSSPSHFGRPGAPVLQPIGRAAANSAESFSQGAGRNFGGAAVLGPRGRADSAEPLRCFDCAAAPLRQPSRCAAAISHLAKPAFYSSPRHRF